MFLISGQSDVGIKKSINQDSVYVARLNTSIGEAVFACICDGMGGLKHGELASATVIHAFRQWVHNQLKYLTSSKINQKDIVEQWSVIIEEQNRIIRDYGAKEGISLGTTLNAILIAQGEYFAVNIGDSRLYEITKKVSLITKDHTYVQREIDAGRMTVQDAMLSKQKHILTRCIGATDSAIPDFYFGKPKKNAVYMLCSDGFRHRVTENEMIEHLNAECFQTEADLYRKGELLIELNKERMERDNISIAMVACK